MTCCGRPKRPQVHIRRRPHRPEAQDVALSRPKRGFESRWGRHIAREPLPNLAGREEDNSPWDGKTASR